MDPFNVTVPGSRYPISIPAPGPVQIVAKVQTQAESVQSTSSSSSSPFQSATASRIRRKPIHTYKSPTVSDGFRIDGENTAQRIPPSFSSSSHTSSSQSEKPDRSSVNLRRHQPSLPLYHPLGRLAQSLPSLDARVFGLDNVSVDDHGMQIDDAEMRRASARARRPAAKLRDRDQEEGEDQSSVNGAMVANGAVEARPATSPRKRRAVGTGGAGGPKRRRKDVDDGTFPQPARRTRNPRGAAVASPLAGVAIAATDAGEDGNSPAPLDTPDLQTAVLQAQEARPVRSTRSRAPLQRRGSTSSSSTSVSVSIAIHTQQTRVVETQVVEAPVQDVDMTAATPATYQRAEVEKESAEPEVKEDSDAAKADPPPSAESELESKQEAQEAVVVPPDVSSDLQSLFDHPVLTANPVAAPEPQPSTTTTGEKPAPVTPMRQDEPKPAGEEKEEGELSDVPSR